MAKVTKVWVNTYKDDDPEQVVYAKGKLTNLVLPQRKAYNTHNKQDNVVADKLYLNFHVLIDYHGRNFTRRIDLDTIHRNREIKTDTPNPEREGSGEITFDIEPRDYEATLIQEIFKLEEKFCLSETELLEDAYRLIRGDYEDPHFIKQKEIAGNIVDGLLLLKRHKSKDSWSYDELNIIAFEAKTNKDNYKRLSDQIDGYLTIVDEVYLIIEDKDIPDNLPYHVGVIRVSKDGAKIARLAHSLKHGIEPTEFWSTLLQRTGANAGLSPCKSNELVAFFHAVEDIKRKLLWNQFIEGFSSVYPERYIQLTPLEKFIIKEYCRGAKGLETLD